jgi:hypothetical protein
VYVSEITNRNKEGCDVKLPAQAAWNDGKKWKCLEVIMKTNDGKGVKTPEDENEKGRNRQLPYRAWLRDQQCTCR